MRQNPLQTIITAALMCITAAVCLGFVGPNFAPRVTVTLPTQWPYPTQVPQTPLSDWQLQQIADLTAKRTAAELVPTVKAAAYAEMSTRGYQIAGALQATQSAEAGAQWAEIYDVSAVVDSLRATIEANYGTPSPVLVVPTSMPLPTEPPNFCPLAVQCWRSH